MEAALLSPQTQLAANGGVYALLGPCVARAAARTLALQASVLVEPHVPRYLAIALSPYGELTLACRTVMRLTREITKEGLRTREDY